MLYPQLYLVRSSLYCAGEIRAEALPILLFYSHVSGEISEAFSLCTYHEVVWNYLDKFVCFPTARYSLFASLA